MCLALKCVRCSWNIFYQNYVFKLNVANSSTSSVPKIILQRSRRLWYIHISFSKTIIKMIATQVSPQYEPANWSCIFWIFFGACPKILRQQSRFCSLLKFQHFYHLIILLSFGLWPACVNRCATSNGYIAQGHPNATSPQMMARINS